MRKIKYLSLFSGIGGFELGIQQAYEDNIRRTQQKMGGDSRNIESRSRKSTRFLCIGYSEIDKYAIQIYKKQFNHKNYGDITKINVQELQDFDLVVGGFPCQSFSVAGKRGGFKDTRGTLFFEIARIVKAKRPRLLLLENVKGLLSHDEGNTFATIISTLDELGYDCQWQVLNSKNFGVPQNRERVFIIGHLRGTPRPKVFPIGESDQEFARKTVKQGIANTLTGRSAGGQNRRGNYILKELTRNKSDAQRIYDSRGIAKTLKGLGGGQGAKTGLYAIPVLTPNRQKKRQEGRRFKKDGDPSFTVTAQDRHGVYNGVEIRRLTPMECERLQGFPDGWTSKGINEKGKNVKISDTQRYTTLGNAVTVNVIKAIMERLL